MTLWYFVNIILTLILIILSVVFIIIPAPMKTSLKDFTLVASESDPATNAEVKDLYTLYSRPNNKKLLVWFQGGAFLLNNRKTSYGILNALNDALIEFDVLVFDYPLRFSHSVHDAMLATNKILEQFYAYDEYYAAGFSVGALLMGAFMQKELNKEIARKVDVPVIGIQFKAIISLCGVYSMKFDCLLLNLISRLYIMRGTPNPHLYSYHGLLSVPLLVISATSEFLYTETYKFTKSTACELKVFRGALLPHEFPLMLEFPETKESIESVIEFLRAN
ncbi:OrNVorf47-like-2 [Venturia canescens]|uniref:OrNVorf47-like-2 n=1 Tax=Venturia canescens TaxID=32260 RepID=A0ACB9ZJ53_9HYME|nr:uncharacterized LOC122418220 [Venturia canescens]KAI5630645.1 OrNVorf47-like-2 [Venturia canescens]